MSLLRYPLLATLVATVLSSSAWAAPSERQPEVLSPEKELASWVWSLTTSDFSSGIEGFAEKADLVGLLEKYPQGFAMPAAQEFKTNGYSALDLSSKKPGLSKAKLSWRSTRQPAGWDYRVTIGGFETERCVTVKDFEQTSKAQVKPWTVPLYRGYPHPYIGYALYPKGMTDISKAWPTLVLYRHESANCVTNIQLTRFEKDASK